MMQVCLRFHQQLQLQRTKVESRAEIGIDTAKIAGVAVAVVAGAAMRHHSPCWTHLSNICSSVAGLCYSTRLATVAVAGTAEARAAVACPMSETSTKDPQRCLYRHSPQAQRDASDLDCNVAKERHLPHRKQKVGTEAETTRSVLPRSNEYCYSPRRPRRLHHRDHHTRLRSSRHNPWRPLRRPYRAHRQRRSTARAPLGAGVEAWAWCGKRSGMNL